MILPQVKRYCPGCGIRQTIFDEKGRKKAIEAKKMLKRIMRGGMRRERDEEGRDG
ncbi:hypothetical protein Phum_PHUM201420 [Pediculus humanus corporis]|uniref:Uncharacterized protein n=1 Tax=Pediculus humanus subsp. corporis TaxID=121224 RepID=E0VH52_PEDHC|nr:uncharacterized protein Phum_PHUM201420 [Pediculus humanus corporis]EEB12708.1 hypothetical protein Phum_PHUM201420 [Pediculus humanus corporis]